MIHRNIFVLLKIFWEYKKKKAKDLNLFYILLLGKNFALKNSELSKVFCGQINKMKNTFFNIISKIRQEKGGITFPENLCELFV